MAKRKKSSGDGFGNLQKEVPQFIAYTVLIALFLFAVKVVRKVAGVDF